MFVSVVLQEKTIRWVSMLKPKMVVGPSIEMSQLQRLQVKLNRDDF